MLDLLVDLNRERGTTIVMVLHELSLACRYADHHLIAMSNGHIVAEGPPPEIVTVELRRSVFGIDAIIIPDPASGTPSYPQSDAIAAPPYSAQIGDAVRQRRRNRMP